MAKPNNKIPQLERDLVDQLCRDPVLATKLLMVRNGREVTLVPHQRVILKSLWEGRPFNLLIMGRGMSKTFLIALFFSLRGCLFPSEKMGIVAPSYRQSKLVFDEICRFYDESPYFQQSCDGGPSRMPEQASLKFKVSVGQKGFIIAIPIGDGQKIRGFRFTRLFIDECAQVPTEIIDTVLLPTLNVNLDPTNPNKLKTRKGNQLIMASSAYYQFNHLYQKYLHYREEVQNNNPLYSLHVFTYHDAPPGFIDNTMLDYARKTMPKLLFMMENECVFPADSEGFFSASLLEKCSKSNLRIELKGDKNNEYCMGIDVARAKDKDNFAIVIIRKGDTSHKVVRCITRNNASFPQMVLLVRKLLIDYNIVRISIDRGGGGTTIRDYLAQEEIVTHNGKTIEMPPVLPLDLKEIRDLGWEGRKGKRILDVVTPNNENINNMNMQFRADLENRAIMFPKAEIDTSDEGQSEFAEITSMLDEVKTIVAEPLKNGYLRFDTPDERLRKDRYSALLLALKAIHDYDTFGDVEQKPELPIGFWGERFF